MPRLRALLGVVGTTPKGWSGLHTNYLLNHLELLQRNLLKPIDRASMLSDAAPGGGKNFELGPTFRRTALGGGMTHWTASVVAILLAGFPGVASAQVNCEAIPHGPARTDCYLGLSQFYRGQSDLAAARARAQSEAAWYRAITGTDPPKHRPHRRR
jgi:hypothetical protein